MLPDIPKQKAKLYQIGIQYFQQTKRRTPLVSEVRHVLQHEGEKSNYQQTSGKIVEMNYKEFSSSFLIKEEEMPNFGLPQFMERMGKMSDELAREMTQHMVKSMEAASQVPDSGIKMGEGKPTQEDFLSALSKMSMDFGIDGKKERPSLVFFTSPGMEEAIKGWDADMEFKRKFDEVIERKRQEFYARESHRKLVD